MKTEEKIKINSRREVNKKRYIIVFLLTLAIFTTGVLLSNGLNKKRVVNVKKIEDTMSIDILSSEIQFALLKESGCVGITEKTTLSNELKELARKLTFMEKNIKEQSEEFLNLKKKYTLLQIKDILLMKELSKKCDLKPINILYFYSNKKGKCNDCKKQGYVLTRLSQDNPRLRIYAFDYDLDLGALKTLINVKKVSGENLPAIVIEGKVYKGFQSIEKIQKLLPKLEIIEEKYLKNFDGTDSKVQIQCSEDSQCRISDDIYNICGYSIAVNVENTDEMIEEFSEKQKELTKNIMTKCMAEKEGEEKAICSKEHICEVKILEEN